MIFTIELRPLALLDLQEAYDYYNLIQEDLGEDFLNELQIFLDKIEEGPFIYSYIKEPVRQGKMKRFPYNVIYEVQGNKVLVFSILWQSKTLIKKEYFDANNNNLRLK